MLRISYLQLIVLKAFIEWISGDDSLQSNWSVTADDSVLYLQTQLTQPSPFMEENDRPSDGIAYNAILQVRCLSQFLFEI